MSKITRVAYGKIGQSTIFDSKKWGPNGGNNESPLLFASLANSNPDITFYLVGKSDFSRIDDSLRKSLFHHDNVVDVFGEYDSKEYTDDTRFQHPVRYFEKHPEQMPQVGLFYAGVNGYANIPGFVPNKKNPDEFCRPLEMFKGYAGGIAYFLNETNLPWAIMVPDPRYFPLDAVDFMNPPKIAISQMNATVKGQHMTSKEDTKSFVEYETRLVYSGLETVFLLDKVDWRDSFGLVPTVVEPSNSFISFDDEPEDKEEVLTISDKDIKFMVVCNQGDNSFKRGPLLKQYVLDHLQDVEIYGKWEDKWYEDSRFKGPMKFQDLQKKLARVKYTLCIPINPHWATAKWCEMAHYGIIPFVHPDYDSQNNIGLPEFLRVKDSSDLFSKIEYLESNPGEYDALRTNIMNLLTPEMYSGEYINSKIFEQLDKIAL
jgi:hypothetical protein